MTDPKKDNRGYLYPNNNKTKPTQPDFTGKVTIENKEWRLSAWENKTPDGKKYLSLSVSPPVENTPGNGTQGAVNPQNQAKANIAKNQTSSDNISKDDLDDLDAILKLTDDENPFN